MHDKRTQPRSPVQVTHRLTHNLCIYVDKEHTMHALTFSPTYHTSASLLARTTNPREVPDYAHLIAWITRPTNPGTDDPDPRERLRYTPVEEN